MSKDVLIDKNILIGVEKQVKFQSTIGTLYNWDLDINKKTLYIETSNQKFNTTVQIIGTLLNIDKSWMWAWANTEFKENKNLISISNSLYELGVEENILEFTRPILYGIDEIFPYEIGCITNVLYDTQGFFYADYEDGFVLIAIVNGLPEIKFTKPNDLIKVIKKGVKYFKFDLKVGISIYLEYHGYTTKEIDSNTTEAKKDGEIILYEIKDNKLIDIHLVDALNPE